MIIATLFFLSIYSCCLRAPRFLGPHDTLPCVLIVLVEAGSIICNYVIILFFTGLQCNFVRISNKEGTEIDIDNFTGRWHQCARAGKFLLSYRYITQAFK